MGGPTQSETIAKLLAENERLRGELSRDREATSLQHSALAAIAPRALSIANSLPGYLFLADLDARISWLSRAPEGVNPRALVGSSMESWFSDVRRVGARDVLERVLHKGESVRVEFRGPATNIDYVGHLAPVLDAGRTVAISAFLEDVTVRKRAEKRIANLNRRLLDSRKLVQQFERHVDDVFGVASDGMRDFTYVSPACESVFGLTPEQLYDEPARLLETIHPDDRALLENATRCDDAAPFREVEVRVAGQQPPRWLSARIWRTAADGAVGLAFLIRDVTVHRVALDQLEESRALYETVSSLNADFNFLLVISEDGSRRIEWASKRFQDITGYSPDEIGTDEYTNLVHPDDRAAVRAWIGLMAGEGEPPPIEYRLVRKDGVVLWVNSRIRAMPPQPGEAIRVIGATSDISHSKGLEAERSRYAVRLETEVARRTAELERVNRALRHLQTRLMRAERMRTAEDLAGSIAHSINNPLAALIGHVQMLQERDPEDPGVQRILNLGERIRSVVERTLALFRKGTLDLAAHAPAEIGADLRRELEPRAEMANVELDVRVAPDLPDLVCDRTLLGAALGSVAENALDAMAESGGRLTIEITSVPAIGIIVFRVSDVGPGIPSELQGRVLEPFFTTKGGGTGLGLAIAHGIVQGHDGRLRLDSRPEGGTVVTVQIPLRRDAASLGKPQPGS